MKKVLFYITMMFVFTFVDAQIVVFHENFDSPSNADSVTASMAVNKFGINSRLFISGDHCDSVMVSPSDTAYLTTNSFSTVGLPFVVLSFSHICKIEFFDGAEIEISLNNGVTWTKLTNEYIDPGNSQFASSGFKFNSITYPLDWAPAQNAQKPAQSWWKNEFFNISSLAGNQPNVRLRFALRDGNGNGANLAHGWYIENLLVKASTAELLPPSVHLVNPIIQDTITTSGPFDIYAYIQDPSGIDTAYITYTVNNGQNKYVPLIWISDSLYKGTIPSYTYTNTIRYTVTVIDNTINHNEGSSSNQWFYIKKPYTIVIVGNGTASSNNLPVNGYYNYGWGYMIYKVSDLNFHGKIDSIAFFVNNNVSNYIMQNQKIFMGHSGLTSFGTLQPDTTSMTKVFNGDIEFSGPGWCRFKLSVPFTYNGSNNLVIYWVNKDGSANIIDYPNFRYTTSTTNNCAYKSGNAYTGVFPTSTGTQTLNKPNIRISQQSIAVPRDAGISQILNPTGTVVGIVSSPINVSIKNFGADTLHSVIIKWKLDGIYQDSIPWNGALPEAVVSSPFTLGSSTYAYGPHVIKVWTQKPNGYNDPNNSNDTATMSFYSCNSILSGSYTIGTGGTFPTFAAAMVGLQNCGINGPVTFNILSGTYTGQITIPPISGSSSSNTVTFQSSSGSNTSVILQYASTGVTDNWVVRLNGADNIIFKNLTIKATSSTGFARVIEFIAGANNNRFEGNIIQGVSSASVNTAVIYSGTSASDNDNIFIGNKILNGIYGVYLYGSQYVRKKGFKFFNNEITGWNNCGIYSYYSDSIRIEQNLFQDGPASSNNDHIYLYYNDNGCKIIKNKIRGYGNGIFNGIYLANTSTTLGLPNIIANNFISQISTNINTATGIYLISANLTNVYYNSVYLNGISTSGQGIRVNDGTYGINIVNNILSNKGGGYAIYVYTVSAIGTCDYNDLYTTGPNVGYWLAPKSNLAIWRIASLKDSNSVSSDPQFVSLIDLHTASPAILFKGTSLAEINDDIDGDPRAQHPSIGADETFRFNYDVSIDSIITPHSSCQFTASENIKIKLTNKGLHQLSNIHLYYSINNGTPIHEIYTGIIDTSVSVYYTFAVPANLIATGNYLFNVYISQSSDQNPLNDSINKQWVNGYFDLNAGPYYQGFEDNENFSDWVVLNTDGSIYKWMLPFTSSNYARSGVSSAQLYNGTTNLGEDWLFSRCFNLQAGKTYKLSFWYRTSNPIPQTLMLKYGSGQNPSSMVNSLAIFPASSNSIYQQSISQFVATVNGNYYFGWTCPAGISNNLYIDDINISLVPEQEASIEKIVAPNTGCELTSSEPVKIKIKNSGADTINGNLFAYYKINSGSTISASVNDIIIPGDTILFTFPVTANLAVTTSDVTFNFKSWISLLDDPIHANDTILKQVISRHLPSAPNVVGSIVNYGQTATLQAISPDNILWFSNNTSTLPFYQGASYTTPNLFNTTTYFVAASNNQAGFIKQVGSGNSTASDQIPIGPGYDYGWSSCLFLPGELNFTGKIDTIAYYITNIIQSVIMNDQRIYIRHFSGTALTDVNNPNITNMTMVYHGSINWSGPGWKKIPLDIPFDYDGVSSLELAWENWDGTYMSGSPYFQASTIPTNMVKYKNLNGSFPVGAGNISLRRPNIRFINKGLAGCPSTKIPVTATVIIPTKELAIEKIISPVQGCSFGTEVVRVKLVNHGTSPINQPFTAGYYISGNPLPVTETVNTLIPVGDSILYTFNTIANTPVTGTNSTYSFKVFINISGDPYYLNDTISKTFVLTFSPNNPVCTGATVTYGSSATLQANSSVPVNWYNNPSGGSIIYTGSSFTTPILYGNTTYYSEANTTLPGFTSQIGTGASWITYAPTYGSYGYGWSSSLYMANELNFVGQIDTLMYYACNSLTGYEMINQRIYMRQTSANTLADENNPNVSTMSLVFQGSVVWAGPGWNKIVLNTPFYYSGTGNLEIAWENRDGGPVVGFPYFASTNVSAQRVKYGYQSGSFPTGQGTWYSYLPNIRLSHVGFGCPSSRVPVTATVIGPPNVDAGLQTIASPVSPIALGNQDIKVVLRNYGLTPLNSVQIGYKINGVTQPLYNWTGAIPTGGSDTVTIGTYNFTYVPYPGLNHIKAWTQNPNNLVDPTPANDSTMSSVIAYNPMHGIYFIRTSTPDFNSFSEAVACLNLWGIDGSVTIIADTGLYNEHFSIPQVAGSSPTNTITFQSITGVNSDVRIEYAAASSVDNYVVQVNGTDYLRFRNMSLKATSINNYGRVLELKNSSTNNIFEGNKLEGLHISNNNSTNIYCTDVYSFSNTFIGNELLYAYLSVDISGSYTNKIGGFKFIGNKFSNYYYCGVNLINNDSVLVSGNIFASNSGSSVQYALYSSYCDNNCRFEKNKITYSGAGNFYGIYLQYNNIAAYQHNWVSNNFISCTGNSVTTYGITCFESSYINVCFNSVNILAGSPSTTRALSQSGGVSNLNFINNCFVNQVGGYAFYVNTPGSVNISDYNNIYSNGTVLAYWYSDRNNLMALKAASSKEIHSKSVTPNFLSANDLHTYQIELIGAGISIAGITTDIDNDSRNTLFPCIGADELNPAPLDAGISMILTPSNPALSGTQPIKVILTNFGLTTLHNVLIKYSVNGVLAGSYNWVDNLPSFDTTVVNIGNITLNSGNSKIQAWTSLPNGLTDNTIINDSASVNVIVCSGSLAGTYSIGGSNPNYYSITDAVSALSFCGVSGPVTFNIANGTYYEKINIGVINGASASNTITFQSQSGNNTNVVIQAAGSSSSNNYVIQLNGTKYFRFKNITIKNTSTTAYGRVVSLLNNSSNNIFQGNKILSVNVTTNNAAPVYGYGTNIDFNKFIGNELQGGFYGVYFNGTNTGYNQGNEFTNNSIKDYFSHGLYFGYNDSLVVVGNSLRNISGASTSYGIYSSFCNYGGRIEKNYIHGDNTGSFFGINLYYSNGTSIKPMVIANNMISEINGTSTAYGLYISYSSYVNLYYNSVNIIGGYTSIRALYVIQGNNIRLLNNNLVSNAQGYPYYVQNPTSVVQSDYNNLFTTGNTLAYWGTAINSLANLQAASNKDLHSVVGDPVFISPTNLHATSSTIDAKGIPIPGYTTDIDGDIRNAITPDIGADEFNALPYDVSLVAFIQPTVLATSVGNSISVTVQVRNFGSATISSCPITYRYNGGTPVSATWTGTLMSNQTTDYTFSLPYTAVVGTNSLCAYTSLSGDQNMHNDTLCVNFTGVPQFVVPYSDNFEGFNYFYSAGTNNSWEYGIPTSNNINSAHSPTHVWKTNLDGYYNFNELSYLYTPFMNFNMVNSSTLDFWHYFDTETYIDACRIKYSVDGGNVWITLGYIGDPAATNWYNSNPGGQPGWTGTSNGWIHSIYNLSVVPNIVNSLVPVQFRFEFSSNGTNNDFDGWAIDDISFTAPTISKDAGVTAILSPTVPTQTGTPVTVQVTIKNFGSDTLQAIPVRYVVNQGSVVAETWHGLLSPGGFTNYTFANTFITPGSTYSLCAFTKHAADIYWNNDTTCASFAILPPNHNVGVVSIVLPTNDGTPFVDTTQLGAQETVKITIKNFGLTTETSIPVIYKIGGNQIAAENWTGSLASGQSTDYQFTTKYTVPLGGYTLCAKTQLTGDVYSLDDENCVNYLGYPLGIDTYDYSKWDLLQNVPNPANNFTAIDFVLPLSGKVRIEIIDLLGNKIFVDENEYDAGKNQLNIDVKYFHSGIYFYSAIYKNMVRTKRMIITK